MDYSSAKQSIQFSQSNKVHYVLMERGVRAVRWNARAFTQKAQAPYDTWYA